MKLPLHGCKMCFTAMLNRSLTSLKINQPASITDHTTTALDGRYFAYMPANNNPIHGCGTTRHSWLHGRNENTGTQRYLCPECRRSFTVGELPPGRPRLGDEPLTAKEKWDRHQEKLKKLKSKKGKKKPNLT